MDGINNKIAAAQKRVNKAKAAVMRLKRAHECEIRRRETQLKCCLGGTVIAMASRGTDIDRKVVGVIRHYLQQHPPHASNAAVLVGTVWDTSPDGGAA